MPRRKSNMTKEERASVRERNRLNARVYGIADMHFGLGDINSCTLMPFICTSSTRKGGTESERATCKDNY